MAKKKGNEGRLVLTRKINEVVMINDHIRIMVVAVESDRVKIAFQAPPHITVHRLEVYEKILAEKQEIRSADKLLQEKHEIRSVNRVVRRTKRRFLNLPRNVLRLGDRS